MINTEYAYNTGAEFAKQVRDSADAANWSELGRNDEIPDGDYCDLRDHYGFDDLSQREINEIEAAYKAGFNAAFCN